MQSLKLLKPQIQYLIKKIDDDIANKKKYLEHTIKWIEENKPAEPYYQRSVNAAHKKISFLEELKNKILNQR